MGTPAHHQHRGRTLFLVSVLHGFTHLYNVALLPLYLLIQRDPVLGLANVEQATFLVTAMMLSYFVPAYFMGVMADHFNKRRLLAWGLGINASGFVLLSFASNYSMAVAAVMLAGFGGSFFHPSANPLIARLYPTGTGKALGMVGIGASVGFFFGPIYAGWRAAMSGWRAPVLELGLLGVAAAIAFTLLAEDEPPHEHPERRRTVPMFPTGSLWLLFIGAAFCFSMRDFTGSSMGSLGSLFLQKAHGMNSAQTGQMLSMIFLASAISNPLFGHLSDRNQSGYTSLVLLVAAAMVALFPHLPSTAVPAGLAVYGFFFMASFPMVEASLMNSVPHEVRGRVFGLFITIGGFIGNLAHWASGAWVRGLGAKAYAVASYHWIYAGLAALVLGSIMGLRCLSALKNRESETGALGKLASKPS